MNRDTAASEEANLVYSGTSCYPVVDDIDALVLHVEGNQVPNAQLTVFLYYALGV